jgi:hypothetical protein
LTTKRAVPLTAPTTVSLPRTPTMLFWQGRREIKSNGERSVSGGRFDACNAAWKEVINPHVDDLAKIVRRLNGLTAAWKVIHNVDAFADTIATNWSDAQHLLPSLQNKKNTTGQRWVTLSTQRHPQSHPWCAAEAIESRENCNLCVGKAKPPF